MGKVGVLTVFLLSVAVNFVMGCSSSDFPFPDREVKVSGKVTSQHYHDFPVAGVEVSIENSGGVCESSLTGMRGEYAFTVKAEKYDIVVEGEGYVRYVDTFSFREDTVVPSIEMVIDTDTHGEIKGLVSDGTKYLQNVVITNSDRTIFSDEDGFYTIILPYGEQDLLFSKPGYKSYGTSHKLTEQSQPISDDVQLNRDDKHLYELSGTVLSANDAPVADAEIVIYAVDITITAAFTDDNGFYSLDITSGAYTLEVQSIDHTTKKYEIEIGSEDLEFNITL